MSTELDAAAPQSNCGHFVRRRRRRRGASAVEFAAVSPLLVLLLFGCIEYAQLIDASQTVGNASRRGARLASRVTTAFAADVDACVRNFLAASYPQLGASSTAVTVAVRDSGGTLVTDLANIADGSQLTVDVSLSFAAVRRFGIFAALNNKTLQSSAVGRRQ